MATLLQGCAATGGGAVCDVLRPVFVDEADQLTDQTARQLLAHNETWERLCGPRP